MRKGPGRQNRSFGEVEGPGDQHVAKPAMDKTAVCALQRLVWLPVFPVGIAENP